MASEQYEIAPLRRSVEYVDGFGTSASADVQNGSFRIRSCRRGGLAAIKVDKGAELTTVSTLPDDALQFLLPSRYCPSDEARRPAKESCKAKPGYDQVEAIRAHIHDNVEYKYAAERCVDRALRRWNEGGSLPRLLARGRGPVPRAVDSGPSWWATSTARSDGHHAWFEAFVGGRWYTSTQPKPAPRGRIAGAYAVMQPTLLSSQSTARPSEEDNVGERGLEEASSVIEGLIDRRFTMRYA